jgi:Spy/CpxP family protein refolding chaperone
MINRTALFASLVAIVASTAASTGQTTSPYAGQEHRTIKALSHQEIRELLDGRGMGLAKAAELNSYPGPLHVLQLADRLELSDAQRKATDSLYANMRERALSIGRQIIEAERALDRAFADGRIEPAMLRSQVNVIAILRGNLRAVHLETHLAQRSLLTPEQISRYDVLRGYAGDQTPHAHRQHGD